VSHAPTSREGLGHANLRQMKVTRYCGLVLLLCGSVLASGGCAAGGLAVVSPMLSALQLVGDRSVERTIAADLPTALALTEETLTRMAITLESRTRSDDGWVLRGVSQGLSVEARLVPATERLTRIALRVEAGWLTADKQTGEELQNQIARVLCERLAVPPSLPPAQGSSLAILEAEVRSLRMELERNRPTPTPATSLTAPRPAFIIDTSAVVSVPASYGFSTPPVSPSTAAQAAPTVRPMVKTIEPSQAPLPNIRPAALEPVSTLTAVPTLGSRD
jgi:hypothetical protein